MPRRLFGGRDATRSCRPHTRRPALAIEALEARTVPTTTLWLDFGDNFPAHLTTVPGTSPPVFRSEFYLDMTVRQLRDTLSGPDLTPGLLDTDTLRFSPFANQVTFDYNGDGLVNGNDATQLRGAIVSLVQRYYEPFDIAVGIAAARNLTDVTTTLADNRGDPTGQNDAYVFVTGVRSLASTRPIPTGLFGMAALPDIINGRNTRDDSAVIFVNNLFAGGFNNQIADTAVARTVAHEAGHTFGLRHTISTGPGAAPILAQSDVMAKGAAGMVQRLNLNFFTRFPLPLAETWADGATVQDSYARFASDPDIGARRTSPAYVTGTGAHDCITLTRLSDTQATVRVEAFANPNRTGLLGTTSYTVSIANGILVDAGFGNDEVVVDARIYGNVQVRGMAGTDELVVLGRPTMANNFYEPASATTTTLDGATSYHGRVEAPRGSPALPLPPWITITFEEFEPASSVRVEGYVHFSFVTPRDSQDDLTISSPAAGQNRVAGTGIPAGSSRSVPFVPLLSAGVPSLAVEINTLPDTVRCLGTAAGTTVTVFGGPGSDTLIGLSGADQTWNITDLNKGRLSSTGVSCTISFEEVEHLIGGPAKDSFVFADGKGVAGRIDGAGGSSNLLDYSAYTTDVWVILPLGLATGVFGGSAGGISNIQWVEGGAANDILVGDANPNRLHGRAGRDVLIGGAGADVLKGSTGEDILIGGGTPYDTKAVALAAIADVWEDLLLSHDERINRLLDAAFPYALNATTLAGYGDDVADTLLGGDEQDWFIIDAPWPGTVDVLTDLLAEEKRRLVAV